MRGQHQRRVRWGPEGRERCWSGGQASGVAENEQLDQSTWPAVSSEESQKIVLTGGIYEMFYFTL